MKKNTLKLNGILIFYIIFFLCNFYNISVLKATSREEESTHTLLSSRIVMEEDLLHSPLRQEIHSLHSSDGDTLPSSRYGTLEGGLVLQSLAESEEAVPLTNTISSSYMAAFQEDLENGISRSEALKYIACLIGGIGPFIPQIAIAQTIGESYQSALLSYTLIVASALMIEGITSWMIWELTEDTKSLIKDAKQDKNVLKSVGIGLSSLILGALSSAPDVYIKYEYNSIKWLALISLVYDSIPRVIGFCKFFSSLQLDKIKRMLKEPEIEERRVTQIINISKAYFLQKCKENDVESVSQSLSTFTSPSDVYSYLTAEARPNLEEADAPRTCARGVPRKGVKVVSLLLPIASATFNTAMAYKGFKLIVGNQASLLLLSTFSVTPAFFLSSYVVMEAAGNVFDIIFLCRSRIPSSDYFNSFHPKLNLVFLGASVLLGSVYSFSTYNLIVANLADTILDPIKYGIAALCVGTDFIFGTFTIYSSLKRYGEVIYKKFSKGASYVINCSRKLSDLGNSFANFGSNLISRFFSDTIPEEDWI